MTCSFPYNSHLAKKSNDAKALKCIQIGHFYVETERDLEAFPLGSGRPHTICKLIESSTIKTIMLLFL